MADLSKLAHPVQATHNSYQVNDSIHSREAGNLHSVLAASKADGTQQQFIPEVHQFNQSFATSKMQHHSDQDAI